MDDLGWEIAMADQRGDAVESDGMRVLMLDRMGTLEAWLVQCVGMKSFGQTRDYPRRLHREHWLPARRQLMNYHSRVESAEENLAAQPMAQTLWQCYPPGHLDLCSEGCCLMGQKKVVVWTCYY
jgi:hypothetical protein